MTRRLIAAIAVSLACLSGAARAGEGPVVVELFTSQGCSSCPPADAILAELDGRDGIIPLALHVDYWDYIGWKDDFADPANTTRQRGYARAAGERMIYTPQMVVGGRHIVVGADPMQVSRAIRRAEGAAQPVAISLRRRGGRVEIVCRVEGRVPEGSVLHLLTYEPEAVREIRRGENAGRRLTYTNIVTSWRTLENVDLDGTARLSVEAAPGVPLVAMVQAPGHGPILGAAEVD